MGEDGRGFDQLSDPLVVGGYQCMVDGDEILLANVQHRNSPVGITSRSIREYDEAGFPAQDIAQGRYGRDLKILEIGPALSQFMPVWASIARMRPVICDPIDYHAILELLTQVPERFPLSRGARREVDQLTARAKILSSGRVAHVQMTVDQAFAGGALGGDYDIVMNLFTTSMYSGSQISDDALGSLLASPPKFDVSGLYYA